MRSTLADETVVCSAQTKPPKASPEHAGRARRRSSRPGRCVLAARWPRTSLRLASPTPRPQRTPTWTICRRRRNKLGKSRTPLHDLRLARCSIAQGAICSTCDLLWIVCRVRRPSRSCLALVCRLEVVLVLTWRACALQVHQGVPHLLGARQGRLASLPWMQDLAPVMLQAPLVYIHASMTTEAAPPPRVNDHRWQPPPPQTRDLKSRSSRVPLSTEGESSRTGGAKFSPLDHALVVYSSRGIRNSSNSSICGPSTRGRRMKLPCP